MNAAVQKLIDEARREVRRASGLPLNSDELNEERRKTEMDELTKFVVKSLDYRLMFPLEVKFIWTDRGATAQMRVDDQLFHLCRLENRYGVFAIDGHGERQLVMLEPSDPLFASRVLVALGDGLSASSAP